MAPASRSERRYTTSQVARAAGVHPNTVRLYERIGLLAPIARTAGGALSFDPDAPGRGVALRVAPSWGVASPGAEELWSLPDTSSLTASATASDAARVSAELSYGLETPGAVGLMTPYAGLELADGTARTTRLGGRLSVDPGLIVNLEGFRAEAAEQDPDHGLKLRGTVRY